MTASPPTDDSTIPDEALLWRRVPRRHWVPDETLGMRPSSAAFEDDSDTETMSVVLASAGRNPHTAVANLPGFALVALFAGHLRAWGQGVIRDPLPGDPAHCLVVGDKRRKSVRRQIAAGAIWVIHPDEVSEL